ncbi:MAG: protein kinase [Byssovorax sp.]
MDLTPGAVIAGRYKVERKIGAGGMGEVWVGEHRTVGSKVAVKTLLSAAALNHEVVARFKREAYILGRIRSDHVARVVDFVADDVYGLVLVMEFVDGDPLSRVLQEKTLSIEETIDLGVDIASALRDLHDAHIVHRDLKPGNIILQKLPGDRWRAVVVDFGVSRLISDTDSNDEEITGITRADMAVGTIEYMAPEQILNSRAVTSASDIYATGAILYRAVAGRHVFGNIASDAELAQKKLMTEPPPLALTRGDKLATGLAAVVTKALKRRPAERYKTADDLLKDLLPLRDLARVALVDMDSTTLDTAKTIAVVSHPAAVAQVDAALAATAKPAAAPPTAAEATPTTQVEAQPTPASRIVDGPDRGRAAPPPARGGVPIAVMVVAVVIALAGGPSSARACSTRRKRARRARGSRPVSAPPAVTPPAITATAPPAMSAAPAASASAAEIRHPRQRLGLALARSGRRPRRRPEEALRHAAQARRDERSHRGPGRDVAAPAATVAPKPAVTGGHTPPARPCTPRPSSPRSPTSDRDQPGGAARASVNDVDGATEPERDANPPSSAASGIAGLEAGPSRQ